ncbi:PEP-CTERM sorting domain-containing protein [Methylobacillus sp. Pita1]|uniref:PEP-CTERM sorting domain-containing protein n=1 Tax=Methylobacillus sp. Pita1 TaxID=3382642 RepID=UPI0038B48FCD
MLNFKGTVVSTLLIGASIVSQSTLAAWGHSPVEETGIKATLTGYEFSSKQDVIEVDVSLKNSVSGFVDAGAYSGKWSDNTSFVAFCVDLLQGYRSFEQSATYTEGTFSSNIASNLTSLANKYYSSVNDAVSSAAFQVAVWEIVYEPSRYAFNLDRNDFQADNTTTTTKEYVPGSWSGWWYTPGHYEYVTVDDPESLAAINLAKTWLAGIADDSVLATGDYSLTYLKNKNYQDLVVFTSIAAVPEPATYGMLLLGMGVVAFVARRRRANTIRF